MPRAATSDQASTPRSKAAVKREFDILAVWSSDRIGRSMPDLLEVLQTIKGTGTQLNLHTQGLDTHDTERPCAVPDAGRVLGT